MAEASLFGSEIRPREFPNHPSHFTEYGHLDPAVCHGRTGSRLGGYLPAVDERMIEVYRRAENPYDWRQLHDIWLGRVACEARSGGAERSDLIELWRSSRPLRSVGQQEILSSPATVRLIKELFNTFFRDELYGSRRARAEVILSSGAIDEQAFGLSEVLKDCLRYALTRDWYGYSDSRGRLASRQAIAALENQRLGVARYDHANVALTLGGTFTVNAIADFLLSDRSKNDAPALVAIPNYPPLVQSIARRSSLNLVPLPCINGVVSLTPLIDQLRRDTPLVFLQTVNNPTGGAVDETDLAALINRASPHTTVVLDECHECLGMIEHRTSMRAAANVVRISSLSKSWAAPGMKVGWIVADATFIADYYEFASTSYGGPPSFFCLLVETLARMERWMLAGVTEVGSAEHAEFEPAYGLAAGRLCEAYAVYRADRRNVERRLFELRERSVDLLLCVEADVLPPQHSINATLAFSEWSDSYVCFRDLLHGTGVSFLPGILTFCFSGPVMRMTTARPWADLEQAARRLAGRFDAKA